MSQETRPGLTLPVQPLSDIAGRMQLRREGTTKHTKYTKKEEERKGKKNE
jgi:hypothetical protein